MTEQSDDNRCPRCGAFGNDECWDLRYLDEGASHHKTLRPHRERPHDPESYGEETCS